jgi:D-alanyl-D-alanine carboxypeptidase
MIRPSPGARRALAASIGCLALALVAAAGQSPSSPLDSLTRRVQQRLDELREANLFPGATAAIALADGRTVAIATGLSDVENQTPMKPGDRMLSGSIGKTCVAAVAMQLVSEKKLDLDARISEWLGGEEWFARLPNARAITMRMLLNHSSGIREHVLDPKFIAAIRAEPDRTWKPVELLAYVFDTPPLFAVGEGWSYADTNYIVVGIIIERVTGHAYYDELARRILKPRKLEHTAPADSRTLAGLVTGYSRAGSPFGFEGRTIVSDKLVFNPQMEWCGGGLVTTTEDLARWGKQVYEGKAFDAVLLDEMLRGVAAKTGPGDKYGLGVQIRQSVWGVSYGHGGWFPGYLSEVEYFPPRKTAIAVQLNTDDLKRLGRMPRAILSDLARIVFEPE